MQQLKQPSRLNASRLSAPRVPVASRVCILARSAQTETPASASSKAPLPAVEVVAALLSEAANTATVPPARILATCIATEKLKLPGDAWPGIVNGVWQLVWTAGSKDVVAASKGEAYKGGAYVPLVAAAQNYDPVARTFENGIFLGPVAHLTFKGPYKWTGRKLQFDVDTMYIGVGPWRGAIPLKKPVAGGIDAMPSADQAKLPFFIFSYVDNKVMMARGRSGGLALWGKPDAVKAAQAGYLQIYK